MTPPVTTDTTTRTDTSDGAETVTVALHLDDVIELLDLISFCRALCVIAPSDINAAMAGFVVNAYNAHSLGTDLESLFHRIDHQLP